MTLDSGNIRFMRIFAGDRCPPSRDCRHVALVSAAKVMRCIQCRLVQFEMLFSSWCVIRNSKNIDNLKQVLNSYWMMISQELINGAIGQWSKRLLLVVHSQGGHTEHRFC